MSTYYSIYYHAVWSTKHRMPNIDAEIEPLILEMVNLKSQELNCIVHGVNTWEDHIHIAVTIPPSRSIWQWVRDVKGRSTYEVNQAFPNRDEIFRWQSSYSIHSFGKKALPFVLQYIAKQKEHHRQNTLEPYLEQISKDERDN